MKVKQQTFKGFECEITDIEVFKAYYSKNAPLLQGHLLILKGLVNEETTRFLDDRNAVYINANEKKLSTRKKRSTAVLQTTERSPAVLAKEMKVSVQPLIYTRPIRSGESIEASSNLVFTSRINSGAVIESNFSLQIFGIIDGLIKSNGDYLLLKHIGKGTVIFHEEELDASQFTGSLKLVEYKDSGIVIKEIG
ncbi:hypothetical protein JHD50_06620 [Sulfurimonas sp. MAG313]|nr:hypothetical protein [Sulfurimonas sp. MAG313]MDF1880979.1 hypothetical protein [Sulfurimonas sp. MAG313]